MNAATATAPARSAQPSHLLNLALSAARRIRPGRVT